MQDQPTLTELTAAVAEFLRADIAPHVSGSAAFKLRVACNALDLVGRQLSWEEAGNSAERERLRALLGEDGELLEQNARLAARIASGEVDPNASDVRDHLWRTTMEKLAIDQPTYAAYRRELQHEAK